MQISSRGWPVEGSIDINSKASIFTSRETMLKHNTYSFVLISVSRLRPRPRLSENSRSTATTALFACVWACVCYRKKAREILGAASYSLVFFSVRNTMCGGSAWQKTEMSESPGVMLCDMHSRESVLETRLNAYFMVYHTDKKATKQSLHINSSHTALLRPQQELTQSLHKDSCVFSVVFVSLGCFLVCVCTLHPNIPLKRTALCLGVDIPGLLSTYGK